MSPAMRSLVAFNLCKPITRLCHGIGNLMVAAGGGQILNVASLTAFQPGPWSSSL